MPQASKKILRDCYCAHVVVKVLIEQALEASSGTTEGGWSWTIIGPALLTENDRRARDSMLKTGFFPNQLEKMVPVVSPSRI